MTGSGPTRWKGVGWVVLMALPPLIVVVGLAVFLLWQARQGTMTPKWKAKVGTTNAAPARGAER